jgi:hypothetical protein
MRTLLYLALAALLGGVWHAVLYYVLLALSGVGTGPEPLPLFGHVLDWDPLPIGASIATSVLLAVALRRFIAWGRLLPVSLGFWALGGALWPLVWLALGTGVELVRTRGAIDHGDGEIFFLALIAPYLGFGSSAFLIWIVWPLAAGEVWLLSRVLGPAPTRGDEELDPASGPAPG